MKLSEDKEILKEFVQKFVADYDKDGSLDVIELKVSIRNIIIIITPPTGIKKFINIDLKTGRIMNRGFQPTEKNDNVNSIAFIELIAALVNFPKEKRDKFSDQLEQVMFTI